jgi:hypothetical protein
MLWKGFSTFSSLFLMASIKKQQSNFSWLLQCIGILDKAVFELASMTSSISSRSPEAYFHYLLKGDIIMTIQVWLQSKLASSRRKK